MAKKDWKAAEETARLLGHGVTKEEAQFLVRVMGSMTSPYDSADYVMWRRVMDKLRRIAGE
jgi:hypothetical protein